MKHDNEARGVERYPFDPLLKPENVTGLDRLRCISDRRYAATLYEIYALAERNETAANEEQRQATEAAVRKDRIREKLRRIARKALAGTLGVEAQNLARYVVQDGDGEVREDDRALAELGHALAELGAV